MTNIAILGFGVVGGGVADLLTQNAKEASRLGGDEINIKYILDLRDFPDSPFADKIVHDFKIIENDPEIDTVIEVMGGSHPSYEFTMASLKGKKNVITSNKEVVANFGDEFLKTAAENGVSYRFEAAVGGGIPVISPMISCVGQNKICEVRGILNGTTNYILTKMFSFGESFEEALKDAQNKGYAERNPDADVLGIDACRKIAILTSLVTGKLVSTDKIHTEGITEIRSADVSAAESLGMCIKLLGRCIVNENGLSIVVAPFMMKKDSPLGGVSGVYNAVEVIGDPIGNLMFYGQGAGGGATASAVVGDLMQIICSGRKCAQPKMIKDDSTLLDFGTFEAKNYVALEGVKLSEVESVFGNVTLVNDGTELSFITGKMSEGEMLSKLEKLGANIKSRIRLV